jgi:hypothetical protein
MRSTSSDVLVFDPKRDSQFRGEMTTSSRYRDAAPPSPMWLSVLTYGLAPQFRSFQPLWPAIMPRYYFNTRIGKELILDPEGEELRDPDHAWEVARTTIRQLLKTEGSQAAVLNAILEVTDDAGEVVLEFPFAEAVLDPPDEPATRH